MASFLHNTNDKLTKKLLKNYNLVRIVREGNLDGGTFAMGQLIGQKGRSALPGRLNFITEKGLIIRIERNEYC